MNHHELEKELAHLEYVFGLISPADRIPLSYWRSRLDSLPASSLIPAQRSRLARLETALRALEMAALSSTTAAHHALRAASNAQP